MSYMMTPDSDLNTHNLFPCYHIIEGNNKTTPRPSYATVSRQHKYNDLNDAITCSICIRTYRKPIIDLWKLLKRVRCVRSVTSDLLLHSVNEPAPISMLASTSSHAHIESIKLVNIRQFWYIMGLIKSPTYTYRAIKISMGWNNRELVEVIERVKALNAMVMFMESTIDMDKNISFSTINIDYDDFIKQVKDMMHMGEG